MKSEKGKPSMRRRLSFAIVILISQLLLISLAVAWFVHMVLIVMNGSVSFVENNPLILWGEITAIVLITVFAIGVSVLQIIRLGERRRTDDRNRGDQG